MLQRQQIGSSGGAEFGQGAGSNGQMLPLLAGAQNSFLGAQKHEDPLIRAEIDKNIKEQKKILEQDFARSKEDIDRNF